MAWSPTPDNIEVIKRMASAGMIQKMVAVAIGVSLPTFHRSQIAKSIYHQYQSEVITKVGESAIQKATKEDADTAMIAFILKTRGGWRENKSYICIEDFDGDYYQKVKAVDHAFKEGKISIDEYKMLSDTLNDRFRNETLVEQHAKRIQELEKKAGFFISATEDFKLPEDVKFMQCNKKKN